MSSLYVWFFSGIDPVFQSVPADICRLHDPGAKLFAYNGRLVPVDQTAVSDADIRSHDSSPQRFRCGEPPARTPFLLSYKTWSDSTLSCLGGHLQIHGDIEASPVVLASKPPWEENNTTLSENCHHASRPQPRRTQCAGSERPTHHVCLGSKSTRTAHEFLCQKKKLTTSTDKSRPFVPTSINATSPLRCFFLPLKLGGLGVGSAVQRHVAAPWRAWQSIIPTLMATTQSSDTDTLFNAAPRLRAQLTQLQTTLSLHMNKPDFLLKPLGAALRLKNHSKETSLHHPKKPPQANF